MSEPLPGDPTCREPGLPGNQARGRRESAQNVALVARLQDRQRAALDDILRAGWFGSVAFELGVQDGTIQFLRVRVERLEK